MDNLIYSNGTEDRRISSLEHQIQELVAELRGVNIQMFANSQNLWNAVNAQEGTEKGNSGMGCSFER